MRNLSRVRLLTWEACSNDSSPGWLTMTMERVTQKTVAHGGTIRTEGMSHAPGNCIRSSLNPAISLCLQYLNSRRDKADATPISVLVRRRRFHLISSHPIRG